MIGHAFMAGLMGGGPGEPVTFDPTDKGPDVALSGGNLTVNWSQVVGWQNARTVSAKAGGRYYVELSGPSTSRYYGVCRAADYTGTLTPNASGSVAVNVSAASVALAIDLERQLLWARIAPSGNWNSNALADPVEGVGGVDISSASGPVYFVVTGVGSGDGPLTANFGAAGFAADPPYGYERWTGGGPILGFLRVGSPGASQLVRVGIDGVAPRILIPTGA